MDAMPSYDLDDSATTQSRAQLPAFDVVSTYQEPACCTADDKVLLLGKNLNHRHTTTRRRNAQHCRQLRRGSFLFCDITFTAIGALVQSYTNLEWLHVSLLPSREERRAIRQWRLRGIRVHCLYIDDDTDLRESDSEDFPAFDFDDDRSEFPEFASLMKSFPHCRPGEPRQIIGKAVSFMR